MEIKRTTDVYVDQALLVMLRKKDEPSARDILAEAQDTIDWLMQSRFFREYVETLFCETSTGLVLSAEPFLTMHQDGKIEEVAISADGMDPLDDPEFAAKCASAVKPLISAESALAFFAEKFDKPFQLDPAAVEAEHRINGTVHLFVIANKDNIETVFSIAGHFANRLKWLQLNCELRELDADDQNTQVCLKALPENSQIIIDADPCPSRTAQELFSILLNSARERVIINAPLGVDHPAYGRVSSALLQRPEISSLMAMTDEQLVEFLHQF